MKKNEEEGNEETAKTEITVIAKLPNLHALKQFGQDILNAVEKYEKSVKKELTEKNDG